MDFQHDQLASGHFCNSHLKFDSFLTILQARIAGYRVIAVCEDLDVAEFTLVTMENDRSSGKLRYRGHQDVTVNINEDATDIFVLEAGGEDQEETLLFDVRFMFPA